MNLFPSFFVFSRTKQPEKQNKQIMALIEWNDSYNLNIEVIDEQHKKLAKMINDFYDEITQKSNNDLISELIHKMKDYTKVHFKTEEELLHQSNYSELIEHKIKHQAFIDKVTDLEKRFNEGKMVLSFEITNFLKDWLISHIQKEDKAYVSAILQA